MRKQLVIWLLLLPMCVHAKHVFELGLHGGLAGWSAQPAYVNAQVGFQGGAQLLYAYHSPHIIGFRSGVMIDSHNAAFGKSGYQDSYSAIDPENSPIVINYSINNLREQYSQWSVGIPLQLALSYRSFSLFAGAKAVFPFSGTWSENADGIALSVYYQEQNNYVYESYPIGASRSFQLTNSGSMNLPAVQWWLTFELNYTIPVNTLSRRTRSYIIVGAYADYCLTKATPVYSDAGSLITLDTHSIPWQRVITPLHAANRQGKKLIGDHSLFDVGIKVSYALSPYNPRSSENASCHCLRDD